MMDTTMPDNTVLADRAERLVETLKRRDPAEAETQAVCMVMAGLTALQDVRGTEALIAILAKIGLTLRVHDEAAPKVTAGPVPENLASVALGHLRALPLDLGQAQARAAIAAGAAYLRETGDDAAALDTLAGVSDAIRDAGEPAPRPEPIRSAHVHPDDLAVFVLGNLRALAPEEAEGQACAVVAGASAYLVEARGADYASAVVDGLVINATRHIEAWGASPRPEGVPLH